MDDFILGLKFPKLLNSQEEFVLSLKNLFLHIKKFKNIYDLWTRQRYFHIFFESFVEACH
jgi:hypothetical protein